MPTWGEILEEISADSPIPGVSPFDRVRRRYLDALAQHTGRSAILYASAWMQKPSPDPSAVSITPEDVHGLMSVFHGLAGDRLDLILHSPGGSPEAAEGFLRYLRSRFDHIRAIVPLQAMSAATILACGCDEIVMGKHSCLGPIDPQMVITTPNGIQLVPAQSILDQFEQAKRECADSPSNVNVWYPLLSPYAPALLKQCENALALSEELVASWLERYMFGCGDDEQAGERSRHIARALANHNDHKSHGRHLMREALQSYGLKIVELESDPSLQDLALSVFHATTHTFSNTPSVKIIENHLGKSFVKLMFPPGMAM